MQALTAPLDGEWLLASDLAAVTGYDCHANQPHELGPLPSVQVTQLGCFPRSPTVWEHDVSLDVRAGAGNDYAPAWDAARRVCAALSGLGLAAGRWREPSVTSVYANPDPRHPDVPRVTIAANACLRGEDL